MKRTTKTAWMAALAFAIIVQPAFAQTELDWSRDPAWVCFVNTTEIPVRIRPSGGSWQDDTGSFEVSARSNAFCAVPSKAGLEYEIIPGTDGDCLSVKASMTAPSAGTTARLAVSMADVKEEHQATLSLYNPNEIPIWAILSGSQEGKYHIPAHRSVLHRVPDDEQPATITYFGEDPRCKEHSRAAARTVTVIGASDSWITLPLTANREADATTEAPALDITNAGRDMSSRLVVGLKSGVDGRAVGHRFQIAHHHAYTDLPADEPLLLEWEWRTSDSEPQNRNGFYRVDGLSRGEVAGIYIGGPKETRDREVKALVAELDGEEEAWLDIANTNDLAVSITFFGDRWDMPSFQVPARGNVVRAVPSEAEFGFWCSVFNRDDCPRIETWNPLPPTIAGITNRANIACLTLSNPNDVDVWVGAEGMLRKEWCKLPAGTAAVSIPFNDGTTVPFKYFAGSRYKESDWNNARCMTVDGSAVIELALTPITTPSLTVTNDGVVPLTATIKDRRWNVCASRRVGSHATVCFSNLPTGVPLLLEWEEEEHPEFTFGMEPIGPLGWEYIGSLQLDDTLVRTLPGAGGTLEVQNISKWPMDVDIDGELAFRLEIDGQQTVELPRAGSHRVRGTIIPDPQSGESTDLSDYILPDHTFRSVAHSSCALFFNASTYISKLASNLSGLPEALSEEWDDCEDSEIVAGIAELDGVFLEAKRRSARLDFDAALPGEASYEAWKTSVEKRRDYPDAVWQHIVETTEASGSWNEFFARY